MFNFEIIGICILAYLIGSLSPSIMFAKSKGIDIKKEGSGNAGTTNVLRTMGRKFAVFTMLLDILKGLVPVLCVNLWIGNVESYIVAVAVFAGHVFPLYYKFKGGKGVATAFGAIVVISPIIALVLVSTLALIVLTTKMMSLASVSAGFIFPILVYFIENDFFYYSLIMAAILIFKHKDNIKRLIKGEESKIKL